MIKRIFNGIRKTPKSALLWLLLIIPYALLIIVYLNYQKKLREIPNAKYVLVDKGQYQLSVISYNGEILKEYSVSIGKNFGTKEEIGDLRTPEGIFSVISIENSSDWEYDFEDDTLPSIIGVYGPYFLRLNTEFKGIGIHGTHNDSSLKTRSSHGCIRMNNEDLRELIKYVQIGTSVIIIPSKDDL